MRVGRLPNLVIAGVSRAGTTALFTYLSQHPNICPSLVKETGYFLPIRFGERELPPLDTYERHFARCAGERYAMEATPGYLYGGRPMIAALREHLAEPRVLVSLRNPVDRLWSYYTYRSARAAIEGNPGFEEYVERSLELRRRGVAWTREHRSFWALSGGFYVEHLDDWLDAFGDALKVVFFENLAADAVVVVEDVCRWLDIDAGVARDLEYGVVHRATQYRHVSLQQRARAVNGVVEPVLARVPGLEGVVRAGYRRLNRSARARRTLDAVTRRRLEDLYRDSNRMLVQALQERGYGSLPAWLKPAAG